MDAEDESWRTEFHKKSGKMKGELSVKVADALATLFPQLFLDLVVG